MDKILKDLQRIATLIIIILIFFISNCTLYNPFYNGAATYTMKSQHKTTVSDKPTPTETPYVTSGATSSPSQTPGPTYTPVTYMSQTPTPTISAPTSPPVVPTATPSTAPTTPMGTMPVVAVTPTVTASPGPTITITPSPTPTISQTPQASPTPSPTPTIPQTPHVTPTLSPTPTPSPTQTPVNDSIPPVPGNSGTLSFTDVSADYVDISWIKATDDTSEQTNISYKVVYSLTNDINTVASAETSNNIAVNWTEDISSARVEYLDSGITYFFTVIVRDEAGNKAVYDMPSTQTDIVYLVNDTFESYSLGKFSSTDYTISHGNDEISIVNDPDAGNKALLFQDTATNNDVFIIKDFPIQGNGFVMLRLRVKSDNPGGELTINLKSASFVACNLVFTSSNTIAYKEGMEYNDIGTYTQDRWYDVEIIADIAANTYSIYVDSESLKEGQTFSYASPTINGLGISTTTNNADTSFKVDDLAIY